MLVVLVVLMVLMARGWVRWYRPGRLPAGAAEGVVGVMPELSHAVKPRISAARLWGFCA
jgi:hypothetical protein